MAYAKRVYRLLLRFYPARFREQYTSAMERQFADEYRDLTTRGERFRFWMRTSVEPSTWLLDRRFRGALSKLGLCVAASAVLSE